MPAYITAESVRGLSPSSAAPNTTRDELLADTVIPSLMRRIDQRTGQFFAAGFQGTRRLPRFEIKKRGSVLVVPRMHTLDDVEIRRGVGDGWTKLDADSYEGYTAYPQKWEGIDTIELAQPVWNYAVRVTGAFGWAVGSQTLETDPVPAELKQEAEKQARQDLARLPIGGQGGTSVQLGDLEVMVDGWLYLMTVNLVLRGLTDYRRISGG